MSNLNSWEDDPAAQEETLAQQTQQMHLGNKGSNRAQASAQSFHPGASTFTPGAAAFQPGQQSYGGTYQLPQYQQGGAYYSQQPQGYPSPYGGQQAYGHYGQGGYGNVYGQGQGQGQSPYNQAYGQPYGGYQAGQQFQQPQAQSSQQPPTIAQRSTDSASADAPKVTLATKEGGAKVLSIGGDAPKPKTLVLSVGDTNPAKKEEPKKEEAAAAEAEEGAKVTASKAIEKTGEKAGSDSASGRTSPTPASSGRSSPGRGAAATAAARTAARDAAAVEQEQTADVDEETLKDMYGKEHVNIIFIGHVDAGKSTLGGAILVQTGMVDQRTLDKYKRDAQEMGRPTWYLSWALDLTKEERTSGKTVEVGRGFFETDKRKYSILDAPGHKTYVPSMIGGASQADVGILVISARKGEYETGFEKGGQTREHAMLAKTQGVNKLVVAINKMDDPTVEWSEERYKECITKLGAFLKSTGYNLKTDVFFMPLAAQSLINIKERIPEGVCPWYKGPSLLEYLDDMQALERKLNAPFMMPVAGKYRDLGTMVEGRVEAGVVKKGMSLIMMPNKAKIEATAVYGEQEDEVPNAQCGDQVRMRLRGIEEEDILPGFVLCSPKRLVNCVKAFEAQIRILELKSILSAGFNCVLHVHAAIEEVTFSALLHSLQKGTGRKSKRPPTHAKRGDSIIARMEITGVSGAVCIEKFEDYPQMGRFTLRDQGQTIAIGKVIKLITDEAA